MTRAGATAAGVLAGLLACPISDLAGQRATWPGTDPAPLRARFVDRPPAGPRVLLHARAGDRLLVLLLDTGAAVNVLDPTVLRDLPRTQSGTLRLEGATGELGERSLFVLDDLRLSRRDGPEEVRLENVTAVGAPLPASLTRELGVRIDGLIGMQLLLVAPLRIDFATREVVMFDEATFEPPADVPATTTLPSGFRMQVRATLVDDRGSTFEGTWMVDTGADTGVFLTSPRARARVALDPAPDAAGREPSAIRGLDDRLVPVHRARLAAVRVGGLERSRLDALVLAPPPTGDAGTDPLAGVDGLLGSRVLRGVSWTLWLRRGRSWWQRRAGDDVVGWTGAPAPWLRLHDREDG